MTAWQVQRWRAMTMGAAAAAALWLLTPAPGAAQGRAAAAPNPVLVLDTARGVIEIELFPRDAPKTVAHISALVKRNFYRGFRFHRVVGTLAQVGDPLSRDMSRQAWWGRTDTGDPIGAAEFSKRLTHQRGSVGMAHSGNAAMARSQFYIMKQASPGLDGVHAIFGRVVSGMAVVDQLKVADVLKNASIREKAPTP